MPNKKRKFADDGWAVWIDGDDHSTVYINEWLQPKGKSFVDIGIRMYGTKNVKNVNVFSPFPVEEPEVVDLSYMITDTDVLRSLFNTNGKVDTEKNQYTSELRYNNRTISLVHLSEEYVKTKHTAYGTVITVDFTQIHSSITADEAYLIFRLPYKTIDGIFQNKINMSRIFHRINSLIHSPIISEKYGHSIRINEARRLPEEINEIEVLQQQRIRKVVVTISLGEDYDINDSTCYRIRRLEAELNHHYAPLGYPCSDAIHYQWVDERDANMKAHYNFYFTLEHTHVSKISMVVYLLLVLIISFVGQALYELIRYFIDMF